MIIQKNLTYFTIDKLGDTINIPVRYSSKAKNIIIKITNNVVELVLPNKNLEMGYKFLLSKESWIRKKLYLKNEPNVEIDNNIIPIFGKLHLSLYVQSVCTSVKIENNIVYIYSPSSLYMQDLIIKFLQNKLLLEVTNIVNVLKIRLKLYVHKIRIMNNKTKWGSCSNKAVLSFNWRLIFAPQEILNYVIIHEICHLVEMNHSKNFWKLVTNLCPNWKNNRLWLKQNGFRLYQYCTNI